MKRYDPADALDGDVLVHTQHHLAGPLRPEIAADVEALLHHQAFQLNRRAIGPVTWEGPEPSGIRPDSSISTARLPTEPIP